MAAVLLALFLCKALVTAAAGVVRDGLVQDVPGWSGLVYRAIRWEPICGVLGTLNPNLANFGTYCVEPVRAYRNVSDNRIAYFDPSGRRFVQAGIGLGTALCVCFALADSSGDATDICWYFNEIGQYVQNGNGIPYGSYIPGGMKSLPSCGSVDLDHLQAQWSQTAIMPTFNGSVETLQTGMTTVFQTVEYTQTVIRSQTVVQTAVQTQTVIQPQTVVQDHTIIQTQTYTITPTVAPITVTNSTIFTAPNGQLTTREQIYVTTAAVLAVATYPATSSDSNRPLALGLVFG
ncbi:hypothetical protein FRC17_008902, partial [Serendipita sp. 399]